MNPFYFCLKHNKMKKIKHISLILLSINSLYGQNINGRYEGAVSRDGSVQLVSFDFYNEEGIQKGTYEIPENGFFDVPIDDIKLINDTLHLKFYFGNFFCFISENKKEITGISEKWNPKIRLHIKESYKKEKPYAQKNITFQNGDIQLFPSHVYA